MWPTQCNDEFGYQPRICSRVEENHGKLRSNWRTQTFPMHTGLKARFARITFKNWVPTSKTTKFSNQKDQLFNALCWNYSCLFWEHEIYKYAVSKMQWLKVKGDGTYSHRWDLKVNNILCSVRTALHRHPHVGRTVIITTQVAQQWIVQSLWTLLPDHVPRNSLEYCKQLLAKFNLYTYVQQQTEWFLTEITQWKMQRCCSAVLFAITLHSKLQSVTATLRTR